MKGTVVATWIQTARSLWGNEATEKAMQKVGWPADRLFSPTEDIDDAKPKNFVAEIANLTGKPQDEIWMAIGKDNIKTFFKIYPAFFKNINTDTRRKAMIRAFMGI